MGVYFNKTSTGDYEPTTNKELEKLLKIAQESNLEVPEQKPTLLERLVGALRASETSGIAADIQAGKPGGEVIGNYGKRIAKGWTGQGLEKEDLSGVEGYKDVLTKAGVSDKPWFELGPIKPNTAGVLGFAGDVLLDPLTYASFGTTAVGKQAGKTIGREVLEEAAQKGGKELAEGAVKKAPVIAGKKTGETLGLTALEQAKRGQKSILNIGGKSVVPKGVNELVYGGLEKAQRKIGGTQVGETIDSFRKIFNNDVVPLSLKGTAGEVELNKLKIMKRFAQNTGNIVEKQGYEEAVKQIQDLKKLGGKDPDKIDSIMKQVIDAVEKTKPGDELKGLDENILPIAEKAKEFRDYIQTIYKDVGGGELTDDEIGWWLHMLDPADRDKLAKQAGYSSREFTDKIASDYVRKYGKVIDGSGKEYFGNIEYLERKLKMEGKEVKSVKQATLEELNTKAGLDFKFSQNLPLTTYMMAQRVGKKAAGVEYFSLSQSLGKATKDAPNTWVKSTAPFFKDKDIVFSPEVAKHIDASYKAYFSDEALKDVIGIYDKLQNVFKSSVTAAWPAFHVRNFVSNIWQNYLGGVTDPTRYTKAMEIIEKARKGGMEALSESDRQIYQSFLDNGLSGYGYFGGDITKRAAERGIPSKTTPLNVVQKTYGSINKTGMKIGNYVEDIGKFAHFIDKVKKGYSSVDAATSVRKYLFDYTDLTPTEKNIFKKIAPFYTFTRKNIPMELTAFATQPAKFSNLNKLMRTAGYEPGEEGVPSYMREKPSFKINGKRYSGGLLDIPAFEILEMAGDTKARSAEKTLSKLLSPIIKVPLESVMDRSMFRGKPLSESTSVEPLWGEQIFKYGLQDKLKVQKVEKADGESYYVTTDPNMWNMIRAILSRAGGTISNASKVSKKELGNAYVWANVFTGLKTEMQDDKDVKAMSERELEKKLFEFLRSKGKVYKFDLYGAVKK